MTPSSIASSKAVRRSRKRRGLDDRGLEVFQLGLRVAERVGLQGDDVEPGCADQRLQRQEVGEREDVDAIAEAAQGGPDVEESDDAQTHVGVAGHDSRKRGRHELEVAVVRRCPAEVADGRDPTRLLGCMPAAADFRGPFQLQVIEEVGNDPGGELGEVLDACGEELVGGDGSIAEAQQRPDSRHRGEPLVEHRLPGVAIERFQDEAHVPGVEDQVVDVEQDTAPGGTGTGDEAVKPCRVTRPADDQRADLIDEALEYRQLGSREPRRRDALTVIFEAECLDHVEHAIAKRARVRNLVEVGDGVHAWCGDPAHTLVDARRPRIRKLRRSCPGPHRYAFVAENAPAS